MGLIMAVMLLKLSRAKVAKSCRKKNCTKDQRVYPAIWIQAQSGPWYLVIPLNTSRPEFGVLL